MKRKDDEYRKVLRAVVERLPCGFVIEVDGQERTWTGFYWVVGGPDSAGFQAFLYALPSRGLETD